MTVSTDGQICYGILFGEDVKFPWDTEEWQDDIEEWWTYEVCGYKNPFELYDDDGNYLDDIWATEEKIDEYYDRKFKFQETHPLPVSLVNYCSGDFPLYILTLPQTIKIAKRGYPEILNSQNFVVSKEEKDSLLSFCFKHGIAISSDPQWYLSSYWG